MLSRRRQSQNQKVHAAIAVDAEEKIKGYDLVSAIYQALEYAQQQLQQDVQVSIDIVKVSPWGNFIPALNALVSWAAATTVSSVNPLLLFISAETQLTAASVDALCEHMDATTLVAGARLQGHDYQSEPSSGSAKVVELNGRTTPWNTAAVWNLRKLSLLGFPLVAEGLVPNPDGRYVQSNSMQIINIFHSSSYFLFLFTSKFESMLLSSQSWRRRS